MEVTLTIANPRSVQMAMVQQSKQTEVYGYGVLSLGMERKNYAEANQQK